MRVRPPAWIVGLAWLFTTGIGAVGASSCVGSDPDHCHHKGGDEACGGQTPFCDACSSSAANGGCVADPPEPACASTPGPSAGSSGSSSTGDAGSDSSTGTPVQCTAVNARDDACPEALPYCVDEVCIDCAGSPLGGDGLCATAEDALPYCAPSGQCVACDPLAPASCEGEGEFCHPDGSCGGCFEHSQCGEHGCDLASGQCMTGFVWWMEPVSPLPVGEDCGFGTAQSPYCKLSTVAEQIESLDDADTQVTVRLRPGNYTQSFVYDGPALVVFVVDDPEGEGLSVSLVADDDTSAIDIAGGGRWYSSGIRFEGRSAPTIRCRDSGVRLQDSTIADGVDLALAADNCDVTVERGLIARNAGGGLSVVNSELRILSTGIVANGDGLSDGPGVLVDGGSLWASHATIVANLAENEGRNLRCRNAPEAAVRNAIIMGEAGSPIGGCGALDLQHSVVDVASLVSDANGVRVFEFDPEFFVALDGGDPRLHADAPFGEVAQWAEGDPALDIDRQWRNAFAGATNDPGCDQRVTPR